MSDAYVLDSSAIICLLGNEPGAASIEEIARAAVVSAVNLAEVVAKLQERGGTDTVIDAALADLELEVEEFDAEQAILSGKLRNATRSKGLSLGDRACLALAASRNGVAVTTDRAWQDLDGIARIMLVR